MTNLSYEIIDTKPLPFDFSTGYSDVWDIAFRRTPQEIRDERYVPIYNFLYALGDSFAVPRDIRRRLNNTTVVRIDDRYHLALTGAGMDFSWEICESYLNLGYYPPAHFSRLPGISDRGTSLRDERIVRGCVASLDALVKRYQRDSEWMAQTFLPGDHD